MTVLPESMLCAEADVCEALGGVFYAGVQCGSDPCGLLGACCLQNGSCVLLSSEDCTAHSGSWLGEGTSCTPNPCPPTPVERTSWGRIKQQYR